MTKKTLEEKIKRVCLWAAGLTILYFLIGGWLTSDGPNFDPSKTYDLLKDALTLTAAFLAPVAAFVLFSDWRIQHRNLSNEKQALNLYHALESLNFNFLMVAITLQTKRPRSKEVYEEIDKKTADINKEIQKIIIESNTSHSDDRNMKEFLECYYNLIKQDFLELYGTLGMVIQHCKILDFPEDYPNLFLESETSDQFIERQKREFLGVDELTLFEHLKEFRTNLDVVHEKLQKVKV
jgi:hypothetical protein